jgi:hypothetical protein
MLNKNIDLKNGSFSFSDYFKMNIDIDELVAEFGYEYERKKINVKRDVEKQDHSLLYKQIDLVLNAISLNSEIAIREFLIAPVLLYLLSRFKFKIKPEKTIYFNEKLRGVLDYYIDNLKNSLVIIEAKNMDLHSGFRQLAMELIALDKLVEDRDKKIYGVVTIGTNWIFATLDRDKKILYEDSKTYNIPENLDEVLQILSNIFKAE